MIWGRDLCFIQKDLRCLFGNSIIVNGVTSIGLLRFVRDVTKIIQDAVKIIHADLILFP